MNAEKLIYGRGEIEGIVQCEFNPIKTEVVLVTKQSNAISTSTDKFDPWVLIGNKDLLSSLPKRKSVHRLEGNGWNLIVRFNTWSDMKEDVFWLSKNDGSSYDPKSRAYYIPQPATQYFMMSGNTPFKGLTPGDLNLLSIDIEVYTPPKYQFPNAKRKSDEIILVSLADNKGWSTVIGEPGMEE